VKGLPQFVLDYARRHRLLKAGDRVGVAVSGGADSVALLRLLIELRKELGLVLSVVHFNHKLRGAESDADERFVTELAQRNKLELCLESGDVAGHAAEKHLSLEAAARAMRYQYFRRLLQEDRLTRIATGHTLDDQAETVLLKIVRGAGTRGLAGVYPQLTIPGSRPPAIVRPLLGTSRKNLEAYLLQLDQNWREDKSNRDLRHMRNRVRHGILPRMERYVNPAVREALAETAEIARGEEEYWQREVARILPLISESGVALCLPPLLDLPLALQRRVVRAVAESLGLRLEFRQVEGIIALGDGLAASTELHDGWKVSRKADKLSFEQKLATPEAYEYSLSVPGSVEVEETQSRFEAVLVSGNGAEGYNPEDLMDGTRLSKQLSVRNWRPGDRFWPAHTKVAKKIKELLAERHVTGTERKMWPVVVSGANVVWVRGFRPPRQLSADRAGNNAVVIQEVRRIR
jgi:tRNA(Ile)-lysidine synthase